MLSTIGVPLAFFGLCSLLLGAVTAVTVIPVSRQFGGLGAVISWALLAGGAALAALWRIRSAQSALHGPLDQRDVIPVFPIALILFACVVGAASLSSWRQRQSGITPRTTLTGAAAALAGVLAFIVVFIILDFAGMLS